MHGTNMTCDDTHFPNYDTANVLLKRADLDLFSAYAGLTQLSVKKILCFTKYDLSTLHQIL